MKLDAVARATVTVMTIGILAAPAHARKCRADAVQVGDVCVDKYEASAWETTDPGTIRAIQKGRATAAGLTGSATQRGASSDDYEASVTCPDDGSGCVDLYAVSIPGVTPARFVTWFQAVAMCRNAGKRLTTNQEWSAAVLGTQDPGASPGPEDCNTNSAGPDLTGARENCVSDVGAFDMVGNLDEMVSDWVALPEVGSVGWGGLSDDIMSLAGTRSPHPGGAGSWGRSGNFGNGTDAGPLYTNGFSVISPGSTGAGFRCARDL